MSLPGPVRQKCHADGIADGAAADIAEEASQAAVWAAVPEVPRDLVAHEQVDAEEPDITLPRRQMQALHQGVPRRQDEPHAAEEGVRAPPHQEEEAEMGQGGQGSGSGEAEELAKQDEKGAG